MGKDIFISYRREGGEHLALLIYHQLRYDGYSVFLDVESLRKGKFDEALFDRIREATDFVLILPPGALDRCGNPEDWVRQEIEFAMQEKKNIIPIMMEGFDNWPENLPETMKEIGKFNGLKNHQGYFGDMIRKLEKGFLESAPQSEPVASESPEDEAENLTRCQVCGSDKVTCADKLPDYILQLRCMRHAIRWWVCLTPVIFVLVMLLGTATAEGVENAKLLGIELSFLARIPVIQIIEFAPGTLFHFPAVMISLLLMGNAAYRYTETMPVRERETKSRFVTISCGKCNSQRKIRVSAAALQQERNTFSERLRGFAIFAAEAGMLVYMYYISREAMMTADSGRKMIPVFLVIICAALFIESRIGKVGRHMNSIPEKTFRNYLVEDFPAFLPEKMVAVYEETSDSEFPEEPELTVINPRRKD